MTRPELVAIGWATVDTERAAAGWPSTALRPLPDDPDLGARVSRLDGVEAIVLLEPATEGRLAASLARFGEGAVAVYVRPAGSASDLRARGVPLGATGDGPFGRQALVAGRRPFGPHVIVVLDPPSADTIERVSHNDPAAAFAVRPAERSDAEAIAALFTDEGYPAGTSDVVERLERFDSPYSRVVVADLAGEVLGFLAVHVIPRFEHDDRIVRIVALVVDPGARERGVGHLLMGEAERIGAEVGAAFVEVTAGHHRPEARRLYESLGYDASVTAYLRKRLER